LEDHSAKNVRLENGQVLQVSKKNQTVNFALRGCTVSPLQPAKKVPARNVLLVDFVNKWEQTVCQHVKDVQQVLPKKNMDKLIVCLARQVNVSINLDSKCVTTVSLENIQQT
jgi:ribosomal protein L16 Arg81 hydroxylase